MSEFTEDILKEVQTKYRKAISSDKSIEKLIEKIKASSSYEDAYLYAVKLGEKLGIALTDTFNSLVNAEGEFDAFYGTTMQILEPTLKDLHSDVAKQCVIVQTNKNKKAGMNVKAQTPKLDMFNVRELARLIVDAETVKIITENINHFSQKTVDDTIQLNAEFMNNLGFKITVERTYDDVGNHGGEDVCNFCKEREGVKTFDSWTDAKGDEIFQRHAGCECTIEYSIAGGQKNKIRNYKRKS